MSHRKSRNQIQAQKKPEKITPTIPVRNNGTMQVAMSQTVRQEFSGPIPHPDILIKYNDAIPDGAERILQMAEKQQSHRLNLEKLVIQEDIKRSNLGLWLGFVLAVLFGVAGVYLVMMGKEIIGFAAIIAPTGSLIANFFSTQKRRKEELEAKNQAVGEKKTEKK